jgi:acyl-CoA thioester hydrolase
LSEPAPPEVRKRIEVRWTDLDMLGHLNQAVYHEYLEEARGALFEQLGVLGDFAFVLARVELDYRHEVRKDHGHVEVLVSPERVGRSSITVRNTILLPDATVAADGTAVLVAWDVERRGKRELTQAERTGLAPAAASGRVSRG